MVALSKLYTFERRKYVSPFRSAALEEESDPRINDVVLSTGNINQKYIVRDIVFCCGMLRSWFVWPIFSQRWPFLNNEEEIKDEGTWIWCECSNQLSFWVSAKKTRRKVFSGTFCLWNSDPIYPNNDWLNETDKKKRIKTRRQFRSAFSIKVSDYFIVYSDKNDF